MWISHPELPNVIQHACSNSNSLTYAINNFKDAATVWAKENFGNIFNQKKRILSRLHGIQNSHHFPHSIFLQNLEHQLINDFNRILKIKEDYWKLKSHINWLNEGDANTKYFYTSTLIRRRRNHIISLTLDDNSKIHEQSAILQYVQSYYSTLFSSNHSNSSILKVLKRKFCLTDLDKIDLAHLPTVTEIKKNNFFFQIF